MSKKTRNREKNLHNLHVRISQKDYHEMMEVADKLDITLAAYISALLHSDQAKKLQMLSYRIAKEPRKINICFSDRHTAESVCDLKQALNAASEQTRRIGTNLGTLIRDIRAGKISCDNAATTEQLAGMHREIEALQEVQNRISNKAYEVFDTDNGVTKTEVIDRVVKWW